MVRELKEFEEGGEVAEAKLFALNETISPERQEHLEASQEAFGALHGGNYVETMQFILGARPKTENVIKGFLGDEVWNRFQVLAHEFFNTHMPPAIWHGSSQKRELDEILETIWLDDNFRNMILRQTPTPDEEIH